MLSPYKDYSSLSRWQANLFVAFCNYGIVPAKVCSYFLCVDLILLLMALFFICYFSRTIRIVYAFFVGGIILVVCEKFVGLEVGTKVLVHYAHEWACEYWSSKGMCEG
jgi:uncharacterized membrane protein